MSLGLESKAGALRQLGEEFPYEKLDEIRTELLADAKADGAVKLVQTQIENTIAELTGMLSGGLGGLGGFESPRRLGLCGCLG
jgi:hypothetical protein